MKSIRSLMVIWLSASVSDFKDCMPTKARKREIKGFLSLEPAYAIFRDQQKEISKASKCILGGVGGASPIRRTKGTTAVEIMPRIKIYMHLGVLSEAS